MTTLYLLSLFLTIMLMSKRILLIKKHNIKENFINFLIVYSFCMFFLINLFDIINISLSYYDHTSSESIISFNNELRTTDNPAHQPQDPVKYWPSGTAQSWGIIGAAGLIYRTTPGSTKIKTAAALASLGITIPITVFNTAVENPYGFNRLMFSAVEYKKTGSWPSIIPSTVTDDDINQRFKQGSGQNIEDFQVTKKFISDDNNLYDMLNSSIESLFKQFVSFFEPNFISGYLDELYGFIWTTQVLLFITSISLLILFVIYMFIIFFLLNKEKLNKYLDGRSKIFRFYFKYQTIIANISFYVIPILIVVGLLENIYIIHYLITHPLPIDSLDIDPHIYINTKK